MRQWYPPEYPPTRAGLTMLLHDSFRWLVSVESFPGQPGEVFFGLNFSFWAHFCTFGIYPWWARRRARVLLRAYLPCHVVAHVE